MSSIKRDVKKKVLPRPELNETVPVVAPRLGVGGCVAAVTPSRLLDTADRPSNKKDRKQWSEEMCGPSHKRLATKLSSCGWKVTV